MKTLLLIFAIAHANAGNDLQTIHAGCMRQMAKQANASEICSCERRNLLRRHRDGSEVLAVLAKAYRGQSISKEMDTVEGASIITTFDDSVKAECAKNSKYDVGADD